MCISTLAHIFGERERSIQSNDPLPCLMWLLFCVLVDLASEMQKKKKKNTDRYSLGKRIECKTPNIKTLQIEPEPEPKWPTIQIQELYNDVQCGKS